MTNNSALVLAALKVAKKYPVFPTIDKKPCWSNKELGVGKGEGGYKIATQDPERVKELFSHRNAREIAVPMGALSGLMCIDVDTYKLPELEQWMADNAKYLNLTLCHRTRSGGMHFIFKHPGDTIRFPATLREGVDIKAVGTGYICWPDGIGDYKVLHAAEPAEFPMDLLKEAMIAKGGTGNLNVASAYNDATDEVLIERIQDATDLYPALRTLSFRLPSRRQDNGERYARDEMVNLLNNVMDTSVAADASHARHDDWADRRTKIEDLVDSAIEKEEYIIPQMRDEFIEKVSSMKSFIDTQEMIAKASRPIGPQRETTPEDILRRVAERTTNREKSDSDGSEEISVVNAEQLHAKIIDPIKWIVPDMIPEGGTVSLAGMSNVGKTRWIASLVAGLSVGDTERLGLPQVEKKVVTLWIANEEHEADIHRRLKAVFRQHNDKTSGDIAVRGKINGMMRLVAMNETGHPELDEDNIAMIVDWIQQTGATFLIFDPYVTLSDAMDENSATSASMITKALLLIISTTGVAIMHAHHTPKGGRAEDNDWVRGDSSAWRGSGAIYSALDCGFTLSHWMPKNKEKRKEWKQKALEEKLSRWVVLDTGKIREGEPLDPVVYELVGQEMQKGEGRDIGVCHLSNADNAENSLLFTNNDSARASLLGTTLIDRLGYGKHTNMTEVAKAMDGVDLMPDLTQSRGKPDLYRLFQDTISCEGGYVTMSRGETKNKQVRWSILIAEKEAENG